MTPGARLEAAAQLLDRIAATRVPAESVLKTWAQANRYAGSKDRRAVAERVYLCLRAHGRLVWRMGSESGRALVLGSLAVLDGLALGEIAALYAGQGYGPAPLTPQERGRLEATAGPQPEWVTAGVSAFVAEDLKQAFGQAWLEEARDLVEPRAPIDLRVNLSKSTVDDALTELSAQGMMVERTPLCARGLRSPPEPGCNIQALSTFLEGRVEIQDEGSQIVAALAGARSGETVIDYCAGGGGKTLALAADLGPAGEGRLIAADVDQRRLDNIRPRLDRAGVRAELRRLGPEGEGLEDLVGRADLVFVDAPCSGSGVWRRRPEEASRLAPADVERLQAVQAQILTQAARLVRPGGRLAYVTCSVLAAENEVTIDAFEATHPQFRPSPIVSALATPALTEDGRTRLTALAGDGHRLRLSPRATGTDGFFIALFERIS